MNYGRVSLRKEFYFVIMYIFYIYHYYFINTNYVKNVFAGLTIWGIFNNVLLIDQIALFAIYISTLCCKIDKFVGVLNMHIICKQSRKPTIVSNILHMLCYYSLQSIENYGLLLNKKLLSNLKAEINDCDIIF